MIKFYCKRKQRPCQHDEFCDSRPPFEECEYLDKISGTYIDVNSNCVNKAITYTILSDDKMKEIGFHKNYYEGLPYEKYSPYWWFNRRIEFPKEKRWKHVDIDFTVKIPKDNSDIDIIVLDMDFCQPYDYQQLLITNPNNECARIVKEQVEKWMQYLQDNGVLSGHVYGEYI